MGREGFQPSTIGLKVLDLRPIYLFLKQLYRDARCLKCSTVHNGAAFSPAKLPQSESPSPPTLPFLCKTKSQVRNYNLCFGEHTKKLVIIYYW